MSVEARPATVCGFDRLSRTDVALAGGKARTWGVSRAGLPVPPGFVVSASTYAAFCDAGGLRKRMAAELVSVDVNDADALAAAATRVQALVVAERCRPGSGARSGRLMTSLPAQRWTRRSP